MSRIVIQKVLSVNHWDDNVFSFKTTRDVGLRFKNGESIKLGVSGETNPLLRTYSIASPNYENYLEFFSSKSSDDELSWRLQNLQPGDDIYISSSSYDGLVIDKLRPGKHLYLIATGTGLAPFMSIAFDPKTYENFQRVILFHGVNHASELAYRDLLENQIINNPYIGALAKEKFTYYPSVTREPFKNQQRITQLIESNKLFKDIGLNALDANDDRLMLCGNPGMLTDMQKILSQLGFSKSDSPDEPGDYLMEKSFIDS